MVFHTAVRAALDLKESFVASANAGNKQKVFTGVPKPRMDAVDGVGFGLLSTPL